MDLRVKRDTRAPLVTFLVLEVPQENAVLLATWVTRALRVNAVLKGTAVLMDLTELWVLVMADISLPFIHRRILHPAVRNLLTNSTQATVW